MRRKPALSVEIKTEPPSSTFAVDKTGTLRHGALQIGPNGLLVDGLSPKNSPSRMSSAAGVVPSGLSTTASALTALRLEDLKQGVTLGSGVAGVVKKAEHKPTGIILALKIVKLDADVDEHSRRQTLLELQALHKIACPQIVEFYDAFLADGCIHIALEFMDVGSLRDAIKCGPIAEPELCCIAKQMLQGLAYLHKLHLIHRDLKPENLLLNSRGEVKIADFGVSGQRDHTLSACNSMIGTATYMSPERIEAKPYKIDSDIWSFGVVVLECALGHYPYYSGATSRPRSAVPTAQQSRPCTPSGNFLMMELLGRIVKEPPPKLVGNYSEALSAFITMCLQKTPELRPSAAQLLTHLWIETRREVDMAAWAKKIKDQKG